MPIEVWGLDIGGTFTIACVTRHAPDSQPRQDTIKGSGSGLVTVDCGGDGRAANVGERRDRRFVVRCRSLLRAGGFWSEPICWELAGRCSARCRLSDRGAGSVAREKSRLRTDERFCLRFATRSSYTPRALNDRKVRTRFRIDVDARRRGARAGHAVVARCSFEPNRCRACSSVWGTTRGTNALLTRGGAATRVDNRGSADLLFRSAPRIVPICFALDYRQTGTAWPQLVVIERARAD